MILHSDKEHFLLLLITFFAFLVDIFPKILYNIHWVMLFWRISDFTTFSS